MKTFIIFDIYNLFFRAMYMIKEPDIEMCKGLLLHTMLTMMKNACDKFKPTHLIICSDGKSSWRKDYYSLYKMNRLEALQNKSPSEVEKEKELKKIFDNEFIPLLKDNTNVTFLAYSKAEADDLIARFVKTHKSDNNIIVSTDNDFIQLINENTIIYNSMDERIITKDCIFTATNDHSPIKFKIKDGKVSISRSDYLCQPNESLTPMNDWIEYALFMKCIRGDKSDNIFSAYPGVREKSTKKTVGILDAFADRKDKGYNWQTFMNSTWETPLGEKKLVKECYEFNKKLVDLNCIPIELKDEIDNYIYSETHNTEKKNVDLPLMKFLQKWNLMKIQQDYYSFSKYFNLKYPEESNNE